MARNDGVNRTSVRNMRLTTSKIYNTQQHNEREKVTYKNQDIVSNRSFMNVHFKTPANDYQKIFEEMEKDKVISTRGLKDNAYYYGELVFDVNSAYFHNNGGYEYAKKFYSDAYKAAIEIVGGEQYIISAVMHADERNRAMSEALGKDIYHYHLHVVYVPVVEKQILWSKRCKDKSKIGTVKETIMQVSMSKKWASKTVIDNSTNRPLLSSSGKTILKKSYSILQDQFYNYMNMLGYKDIERGELNSSEEHLTVTQFKVGAEQKRLTELHETIIQTEAETLRINERRELYEKQVKQAQEKLNTLASNITDIEQIAKEYSDNSEVLLPNHSAFETAKSYREKKLNPFWKKLFKLYVPHIAHMWN